MPKRNPNTTPWLQRPVMWFLRTFRTPRPIQSSGLYCDGNGGCVTQTTTRRYIWCYVHHKKGPVLAIRTEPTHA